MKRLSFILVAFTLALAAGAVTARAQGANGAEQMLRLYVDPATKIVYTSPGPHRHLLAEIPVSALNPGTLQRKTAARLRENQQQLSTLARQNQELQSSNRKLTRQMAEIRPAWESYIDNFQNKFRVGTLVYGDYRFYTHTGFQPQELTQLTNPGPGNNLYNSFDLTRTYLNFYFFPTKDWTFRLTPNLYKTIGSSNEKIGSSTGFGSNLDGNLGVRIKYGNLHYNSLWDDVPMLKGGTVSIGQQANPLVGWEEDLYGFRYVNLTPWNYLSLSSTQLGIAMQGPVHLFGSEKTYFDYGFGVYNNASFHAFEETNTKEVMARITAYPFGATWRFQGLGITGFYNYGYGNTTPDSAGIPTALKGGNAHITRIAALLHYTAEQWGLAGEFDYGNNAFSASNLFSGSGPADAFGFTTGSAVTAPSPWNPACSASKPCYSLFDTFGPRTAAWEAILNNGRAREEGFDLFGHYHIPYTPLAAFGMYQWFMPNDKFPTNPLDFERFIVGVSYQVNEHLRFAADSQNVIFYHDQQSVPVSRLTKYGYTPGGSFNGRLLPATGSIPFLVPRDTHSFFLNMEFNY
ncbi:MAG: hypothetical protein ACREQX_02775 [Candidatus Binataceae bacterium]